MPIGIIIGFIVSVLEAIIAAIGTALELIGKRIDLVFLVIVVWFLYSSFKAGQVSAGVFLLLTLIALYLIKQGRL